MSHIVTISDPLSGNKGSSSMVLSVIQNLSKARPQTRFSVFTYYPKRDREIVAASEWRESVRVFSATPANVLFHLVPVSIVYRLLRLIGIRLPPETLGEEIRSMAAADLYLGIGGTTFNDDKPLKSFYHALVLLPARLLGVKLMVYTQTLGPFRRLHNRVLARLSLAHASLVIGRGERSLNNLKELGLERIDWSSDGAFSLAASEAEVHHIKEKFGALFAGKTVVGLSPNSMMHDFCRKRGANYPQAVGGFINYLVTRGFFPVLIPHSLRPGVTHSHCNDLPVCDMILSYVNNPEAVLFVTEDYNYVELRALIGLTDFYVASRFHSMISALFMKRPVLVFGSLHHKYLEVMEQFGLQDYCFYFTDVSTENYIKGFEKLESERAEVLDRIERNYARMVARSERTNALIIDVLDTPR